jgi:hypothetical protein
MAMRQNARLRITLIGFFYKKMRWWQILPDYAALGNAFGVKPFCQTEAGAVNSQLGYGCTFTLGTAYEYFVVKWRFISNLCKPITISPQHSIL